MRNRDQFLAELNDEREVVFEGQTVRNVVQHPVLGRAARAVSQFYELQSRADGLPIFSYEEEGGRYGQAFRQATRAEHLRQRVTAYQTWAEVTFGGMARSPDYMNALLAGMAAAAPVLRQVDPHAAQTLVEMYQRARAQDAFLTHTFVAPFADRRTTGPFASGKGTLEEKGSGYVFSGARAVATMGHCANLNLNVEVQLSPPAGEEPYAMLFLHPMAGAGLKWVCRPAFGRGPLGESSVGSRLDEMDAIALYDRFHMPAEQVVVVRGKEKVAAFMWAFRLGLLEAKYHLLVRGEVRVRLYKGLMAALARNAGVFQFPAIQERLGKVNEFHVVLQGLIDSAQQGCSRLPETGTYHPKREPIHWGQTFFAENFAKLPQHLIEIGGSRLISVPDDATLEALSEDEALHFRGGGESVQQTAALYRLAWELTGESAAVRADLYERFTFGHYVLNRQRMAAEFLDDGQELLERFFASPPEEEHPFCLPELEYTAPAQTYAIQKKGGYYPPAIVPGMLDAYAAKHSSGAPTATSGGGAAAIMDSGEVVGGLLTMLTALIRPQRAVELGTFIGNGALAIAKALQPDARLYTIDVNEEFQGQARQHLADHQMLERVELMIGNASELIDRIDGPIDLAFIDHDKRDYLNSFQKLVPRLSDRGVIVVDNTLAFGVVVADRAALPPELHGVKQLMEAFNRAVAEDPRVYSVMLPVRDGVTLIWKR